MFSILDQWLEPFLFLNIIEGMVGGEESYNLHLGPLYQNPIGQNLEMMNQETSILQVSIYK